MTMAGNSSLIDYTFLVKNYTKMNNKINKKITIHHMAGNLTVEACGNLFNGSRQASSNYAIGTDGRVALYVNESDRAWTSSSRDNDSQAITIEVANDEIGGNWHVSDVAFNKLIDLCVDICKRNNIPKLNFTGDKNGSLTLHYMFTATACPGPYLKSRVDDICKLVNSRLEASDNIPDAPVETNTLYRVQVGAFKNKQNAINLQNKLKGDGYDAIIVEVKRD